MITHCQALAGAIARFVAALLRGRRAAPPSSVPLGELDLAQRVRASGEW